MEIGPGFLGSQQNNGEWEIVFDIPDEGELDKTMLVFRLFNQHNEKCSFHQLDKLAAKDLGLSADFRKNVLEIRKQYFEYLNGYPEAVETNFFEQRSRPSREHILNVVMNGSGLVHTNDPEKRETYKHWL